MLNLLVMPLSKAKALIPLWNDTQISTQFAMAICFVLFAIAMFYMGLLADNYNKKKRHVTYWVTWVLAVVIALASLITVIDEMPSNHSVRAKNIGAIYNVSCYYKMKHLRKIYHTLPCKPYKKKICKTASINKATRYRYKSKHMLTKPKAAKEYAKMKRAYRKPVDSAGSNDNTRNGTRSLKPKAPRWWDYIWNLN